MLARSQRRLHQQRRHACGDGFTLVELMVTLSVAAILLAVAVPSLSNFVVGQRVKTASSDIGYSLTYARSEAIKRRANVTFSPAGTGWQNGWSVSTNTNTLSTHEAFPHVVITGPAAGVTFNDNGRTTVAGLSFNVGSATVGKIPPRCVTINLSGMASTKIGAC